MELECEPGLVHTCDLDHPHALRNYEARAWNAIARKDLHPRNNKKTPQRSLVEDASSSPSLLDSTDEVMA